MGLHGLGEQMTSRNVSKAYDILQLRIELTPTEPRVWRSILVQDSISMQELHEIIQVVMGWMRSHLFMFRVGDTVIGEPSRESDWYDGEFKDAKKLLVRQFLEKIDDEICYEYDFGDSWDHTITVTQRIDRSELMFNVPRCIAGENACPPEDCGGFPGFENLKQILADPEHEEHDETILWLDSYYPNYDPREFSLGAINKILAVGASKYLRLMQKLHGG